MPSIAATIRELQARQVRDLPRAGPSPGRLQSLRSPGSNPGALDGWFYAPDGERSMALVVVLHGCTQTAAGYDHGSGWSDLAERFGFAVLLPEQRRGNNPNLCFNWFDPQDAARDRGEALSIRQMVGAMVDRHAVDPARVFVSGLSAGGAMAGVMLATYPELFAGGSIIAGLPFGTAAGIPAALERMRGRGHPSAATLAAAVRRASSHRGPWPRVTVWHGTGDATVDISNADAALAQWRGVHGTASDPDVTDIVDGQRHRAWLGHDGTIAVEDYRIAGLGHGTPLKTSGPNGCGRVGPHMLEAGISSTWRQAERWGLVQGEQQAAAMSAVSSGVSPTVQSGSAPTRSPAPGSSGIQAVIEDALRSAGLLR